MVALALVHDVEDARRVKVFGPVEDRRKVGRGVIGGAVGLPDDQGLGLEPGMFRMEHDQGAIAFHRQPGPESSL